VFPKLEGLDSLARRDGIDIRPTLLRVLTDLYVQKTSHTVEEERHYTELAMRLVDAVDVATRATVARKLAGFGGAPHAVVRRLARDVIEVAEPLLAQSRVLSDAELAAIVKDFGFAHAAIVARRSVPRLVQDVTPIPERLPAIELAKPDPAPGVPELELADLFFSADSAGRRALLVSLADGEDDERIASAEPGDVVRRIETAALARDARTVATTLERALGITAEQAQRVVADASGEPLLVVAKALGMPSVVLQRVLLFLDPRIGESVQRVFDLAALYERLSARAVLRIMASLRGVAPARPRRGVHQPVYHDDEASRGRRASSVRRPGVGEQRSTPSVVDIAKDRQRTT
jgi:hypothetical protein